MFHNKYSSICNYGRYILVICVLFKTGVEFGLNLETLYFSGFNKYPYRIFANKCEFYFIIMWGTKL